MQRAPKRWHKPLFTQLGWFIRLRWLAGVTVLVGAAAEWRWLHWYPGHAGLMGMLGAGILGYNALLWLLMQRVPWVRRAGTMLLSLAWLQLLLDLGCLTLLTVLTGGLASPLTGFYVFHMIFASLLLPRPMAYAGASIAMLMLTGGLAIADRWPQALETRLALIGWMLTLLLTVWLSNRITRSLRKQRRRLLEQNQRIRMMSRKLQQQQQAMIQHEKMVAAGQMAAGVAHEIANPLASMDGLLQLMERRPEKLKPQAVTTLREQVSRINQIVRQMTRFAHPGDGQWRILGLNELVDKALGMVRFDPRMKRVKLELELAAGMPTVQVISESVQQVLVNLLLNALDAMEEVPEPRLLLRTKATQQYCSISIIDNGPGIKPEYQDRLFEPFFTTKPVGKGTGLGLAISYSLIREHGGEIIVESPPGNGTTFTVRLPTKGSGVREVNASSTPNLDSL
ncbi:MAG: sensor histidine kinase [Bacillota bacterium]